mmetsp:Transcript_2980/g.11465  ORF Transcript_2980/g.11465 Transcript_2980/m.11465 type:complete len:235 (+) Transcript_2980:850-1554(+)
MHTASSLGADGSAPGQRAGAARRGACDRPPCARCVPAEAAMHRGLCRRGLRRHEIPREPHDTAAGDVRAGQHRVPARGRGPGLPGGAANRLRGHDRLLTGCEAASSCMRSFGAVGSNGSRSRRQRLLARLPEPPLAPCCWCVLPSAGEAERERHLPRRTDSGCAAAARGRAARTSGAAASRLGRLATAGRGSGGGGVDCQAARAAAAEHAVGASAGEISGCRRRGGEGEEHLPC